MICLKVEREQDYDIGMVMMIIVLMMGMMTKMMMIAILRMSLGLIQMMDFIG